jgi:hypothetical protein
VIPLRTRWLASCLALAALSCASTSDGSLAHDQQARLAAHLSFLASDAMAGRETGTAGGDITAEYVASVLSGLGLEPAGDDGTYLQAYPLTRSTPQEGSERLSLAGGAEFTAGEQFHARGQGSTGFDLTADAVFVGYGLDDPDGGSSGYDGLDVEGKLVVAMMGRSRGTDTLPPISWFRQNEAAKERGAAGLVLVAAPGDPAGESMLGFMGRSGHQTSMRLGLPQDADPAFPRMYVASDAASELLAAGGLDLAAEHAARAEDPYAAGAPLPGVTLRIAAAVDVDVITAHNVAALLPGSDPARAHEVVVLTAHMDHVGVNGDGEVFNGADDNASGTTTLMMAADVLAARDRAPSRSVLFLAVSGEEKGLLGSEWWVDHPTWPLEDVVANVNMDMVGRNDPDSIGVTPSEEHDAYNTLVQRAMELGPSAGLDVSFKAGEGDYERMVDVYYSRSDHKNFSDAGIPVVFFFAGEHEDYHRVGDTYEKIDLGKVGRVVTLVTALVADTAEAAGRPRLVEAGS